MRLTRRSILLGAGAAGGLILAWTLAPRHYPSPLRPEDGETGFDAWLKIGRDGVVTVAIPDCEMGQGISTQIAQIVAMELGADWRQVAIEPAPVSPAYANAPLAARWSQLWMPLAPGLADAPDSLLARRFAEREVFQVTADGTALAAHEAAARAAAASARAMLAMAAAERWDVAWEECEAAGGFILHDKRHASFAELVGEAADFTPPDPPVLRPLSPQERPSENPEGAAPPFPRLDLPAKVDGSLVFAGDVRLPDMVHAAISHGPHGESALASWDEAAAKGVAGLIRLVPGDNWLAAVATTWWAADRALARAAPRFASSDKANSDAIGARLAAALASGEGERIAEAGDPDTWLAGRLDHSASYAIAPALHATLETASATARLREGKLEIWAASQAPQALREAAARVLGLSLDDVVLYPMPAGGSFDRRLEHDHVIEAAQIARAVGRPVQLTWSRWQEQVAGLPGPPARAVLGARTAPDGSLAALKVRLAMPATTREFGARLFAGKTPREALAAQDQADPLALEGAVPNYAIPHFVVEHVPVATGLPSARLRGNAHIAGCFLIETFLDELAHRAGREALSWRIAMLGGDPRMVRCLQRAAALAQWNGGAAGSGEGLACHRMAIAGREGRIAAIASARRDEGGIRVDKLTVVADIGRVINTDIARQQIEGGLLFGLGLARGSAATYMRGLPQEAGLGHLNLPRLADCPRIEVELIDSEAEPFDPGEIAVAVAPPAIANALFAAGGERLRALPLGGAA